MPLLPDAGEAAGAGEDRGLTNTDGCWGGCGQVPLDGGAVDFGQLTERIDRQVGGFVVVGDLGQPTARVPRVVHRVLRGGGPDASALPVIGVLRGGTIGFGHGDELTGGVVVQGAGAVGCEFVDESSAGVIGPGSAAGGRRFDQLAGVVVGMGGVPQAIDLVMRPSRSRLMRVTVTPEGRSGCGMDSRGDIPGLQLVAGAGFDDAPGGVIGNVDLTQGGVGDTGDAPEHIAVVFDARAIGVDQCGAGAVGVVFPAGGVRGRARWRVQ